MVNHKITHFFKKLANKNEDILLSQNKINVPHSSIIWMI